MMQQLCFCQSSTPRGVVYQTLPVGVLACINTLLPVKEKAEKIFTSATKTLIIVSEKGPGSNYRRK